MQTLTIILRGTTQLLMHNPKSMMKPEKSTGLSRKVIPTPEEEAEASAYKLSNGDLYVPAVAVRNCILSGAKGARINKVAATPIIAGALLLLDETFPLLYEDGTPIRSYEIDVQRAVVIKAAIMRARARIPAPWVIEATFAFNPIVNVLPIRDAAVNAGKVVGLLDYRIEKKGWCGAFDVVKLMLKGRPAEQKPVVIEEEEEEE